MFAATAPPTALRLNDDRHCRRCGYNLRGLAKDGKCPECAAPVAFSIRDELLKYADPTWVRLLALGASLVGFATVGVMVAMIVLMIGLTAEIPHITSIFLVWPLAGLAMLAGQWLITRREPSATEESDPSSRRPVRVILVVTFAFIGVLGILRLSPSGTFGPAVETLLSVARTAVTVVWVVVYFRHLAEICGRIPNREFERSCRRISMLLSALLVLLKAGALVFGPAGPPSPGGWGTFVSIATAILSVTLLIFSFRAVALQLKIARRLRREARQAAVNWSA